MIRARLLIAIGAALSFHAGRAQAQGGAPPDTLGSARIAAPVTVEGEPRKLATVVIPLPGELVGSDVAYVVTAASDVAVLGTRSGRFTQAVASNRVLLTISVPSGAPMGGLDAGHVLFGASDGRAIVVPVTVRVRAVHRVAVLANGDLRGVRSGGRTAVRYTVRNDGNLADTISVRVSVPPGWRIIGESRAIHVLDARQGAEGEMRIEAPLGMSGSSTVALMARGGGASADTAHLTITVASADESARRGAGPLLTLGSVVANTAGDRAAGYFADLDGPLTDDVRVMARASFSARRSEEQLTMVGFSSLPPQLMLYGSRFDLALGAARGELSDVTGGVIGGRGVSAGVRLGDVSTSGFFVHERGAAGQTSGRKAGGRVGMRMGQGTLFASGAKLEDPGSTGRWLEAGGMGAALPAWGGTATVEGAFRRFADGHGVGWLAGYQRRNQLWNLDARAAYAPGGASAFARATREGQLSAGVALTNWLSADASGWMSADDAGSSLSATDSRGGTTALQFELPGGLWLSTGVSAFDFSARTSLLPELATNERSVQAVLGWQWGPFYASASGEAGKRERTNVSDDGEMGKMGGIRSTARGQLALFTRLATLSGDAELTRNEPGSGLPPRQFMLRASLDRAELLRLGGTTLVADATWQRITTMDFYAPQDLVRVGMTLDLPWALRLRGEAARNPYFFSVAGSSWTYSIGVNTALRLPPLRSSGARGIVFEDRNGNGRRDPGEPGVAGVVITRGGETAATGDDGSFSFSGPEIGRPTVDSRSLAPGLLVGELRARGKRWEIPLIPVAPVEVRLTLATGAVASVSTEALNSVLVIARDTSARALVGRRAALDRVVFDALPPGRYTLEVDASAASEPIRVDGELPSFDVGPGGGRPSLEVRLAGRALNIRRAPSAPIQSADSLRSKP